MGRKLIEKENLQVIKYDGLQDFFRALKKPILEGRNNASIRGDLSFTGTSSFEEAMNLMIKGDRDSYEMVVKFKKMTDALFRIDNSVKNKPVLSVEGYQPNVPNAIKGLPNSMYSKRVVKAPKKVIDVFYNTAISASEDPENIAYRGAILLSAIQTLETKGYSINLYVGDISEHNRIHTGHIVRIKSASDRLNVYKTAFYIINPSYLRRIAFRINEVEEDLVDVTHSGYGSAMSSNKRNELIKKYALENCLIYDSGVRVDIDKEGQDNLRIIKNLFGGKL